jgi:PQQ-dependent dehydrogenase (methanol/ethanol family)
MRVPNLKILVLSASGLAIAASIAIGQQPAKSVTDAVLKNAGKTGTEWLSYGLTPGETRYSPLNLINTTNVNRLGLAWSYDLNSGGGNQEGTPLEFNGVIYGITNWSVVYAVDARTGKERWRYDPEVNQTAVRPKLCCGIVSRGIALYQGKIIAPVLDGRLVALDAETGKWVWESRVALSQENYTVTMAPRIAKGKVIVGVAGGEFPVRGFFSAFDANTGQFAWKFYTVPGDPSKPFENDAMKKAATTWSGEWWKMGGGGSVWDGFAYDPEANLIYVGTGNAGPWTAEARGQKAEDGKDNLYAASILAVNPDTGILKWYYQNVPGDEWDYDSVQQLLLADITVKGQPRKVLMQANKDGFYYVIDRVSGKFISGQPFVQVTWAKGLNEATGRPIVNAEAHYGKESIPITPGPGGAHNWSPMSFNPNTGLVYVPSSITGAFNFATDPKFVFKAGSQNMGIPPFFGPNGLIIPDKILPAPPAIGPKPLEGQRGALIAWDPVTQAQRWIAPGGGSIGGGTVTTSGNLVFQVTPDGHLMAYTADKGEKLLDVQTGLRGGMGPPITYELDGKQYVTLAGGTGTVRFDPPGGAPAPAKPSEAAAGDDSPHGPPPPPPPPGFGGGPTAQPKLLTFVLDGKAELPKIEPPKEEAPKAEPSK